MGRIPGFGVFEAEGGLWGGLGMGWRLWQRLLPNQALPLHPTNLMHVFPYPEKTSGFFLAPEDIVADSLMPL